MSKHVEKYPSVFLKVSFLKSLKKTYNLTEEHKEQEMFSICNFTTAYGSKYGIKVSTQLIKTCVYLILHVFSLQFFVSNVHNGLVTNAAFERFADKRKVRTKKDRHRLLPGKKIARTPSVTTFRPINNPRRR